MDPALQGELLKGAQNCQEMQDNFENIYCYTSKFYYNNNKYSENCPCKTMQMSTIMRQFDIFTAVLAQPYIWWQKIL